jgi:putative MATE family efflux protein
MALGSGVQAISARRLGEKDPEGAVSALHGALIIAVVFVLPFSILVSLFTGQIFGLLSSDPLVVSAGTPYLQIRILAVAFGTCNFAFRGYWNGIGMSMIYLRTILTIHVANIFLNWVFIFGNLGAPALGVTGAGLASGIATCIGTLTYIYLAIKLARSKGFMRFELLKSAPIWNVLRLSIPTGVANLFFSGGFLTFLKIAEIQGTREVAVANVLLTLAMACVLLSLGFGIASATLVGKALGEGHPEEARRWGYWTAGISSTTVLFVALLLLLFPQFSLSILMNDPIAEALAVVPLIILGATQPVDSFGMVLSRSLIGAGDVKWVGGVTVLLQWIFFLPLCYGLTVLFSGGILVMFIMMAIWRVMFTIIVTIRFSRGKWTEIKV